MATTQEEKLSIKQILILGTEYTVTLKEYDEDDYFKRYSAGGYCNYAEHEIVLCDMATYPNWENITNKARENQMKTTLRHEIVHAFLGESGLSESSKESDAWARNEEMVDWIALQGLKIYKAWQEADAI